MEDVGAQHAEIRRLRTLVSDTTDSVALAAIGKLIQQLRRLAGDLENGGDGEEIL
jgi:hypothetical protein